MPLTVFAVVNFLMAWVNLLPKSHSIGLQPVQSDGLILYKTLFAGSTEITKWLIGDHLLRWHHLREEKHYVQAEAVCQRGIEKFPTDLNLRVCLGITLLDLHRPAEARDEFIACLPLAESTPPFLAIVKNNLAFANALIADVGSTTQADQYSKEALDMLGWHPSILGTRALVLIETGNPIEGLRLLSMADVPDARDEDKAMHACTHALGLLRLGKTQAACEPLSQAHQLDPACPLIKRVELTLEESLLRAAA